MNSEGIWRATLHDFNNLLAGLQGVLDLSDPGFPFDTRNRLRLESAVEDGNGLIAMARALALGRVPEGGMAPWAEWKTGLQERLAVMSTLFRCPFELVDLEEGDSPWPFPLLQDWAVVFTRQVLPWSSPGAIRLEARSTPEAWVLTWLGNAPLPAALKVDSSGDALLNLSSLWLRAMGEHLGLRAEERPEGLVVRMERPCAS